MTAYLEHQEAGVPAEVDISARYILRAEGSWHSSGNGRNLMYELFILSKLLHRPMHGYLIQSVINFAVGPTRSVSWGTIYPLIKRLEENGYILAVDADDDDPRGKKQYRTTDAGRDRFLQLMNETGEHNGTTADLFRIKVGCFGHVSKDVRIRVMNDYRRQMTEVLSHSGSMMKRLEVESGLPLDEKRYASLALDHQMAVAESELLWVESKLTEMAKTKKAGSPARSGHPRKRADIRR